MSDKSFQHVSNLWDDAEAAKLDPVGRLVYRSNMLGADQRITNTGGGNTSSKLTETDPLTGQTVEVLWVKGSGGDLRTSTRENFSSLYQDKLLGLQKLYASRAGTGPKTPAEDDMVGMYTHCTFNLNPRASSIDTPLHAFIPAKHVDHMHPNAVIAIAASAQLDEADARKFTATRWSTRHGCAPASSSASPCRTSAANTPRRKGIMMGQHGFITWADDDKDCYPCTLDLIEKAAALHREEIRGQRRRRSGVRRPNCTRRCPKRSRRKVFAQPPAVAARPGQPAEALHRHRPGRREDPALRQLEGRRRASPNSAPAAPTISCAPRSSRSTSRWIRVRKDCGDDWVDAFVDAQSEAHRRPRSIPHGLRRLLRPVQARRTRRRCATRTRPSCSSPASA